jgi:hypothetical protein
VTFSWIATGVFLAMLNTGVVPDKIAASVEGCWDLGDSYRVVFRRAGSGLRADEEAETRLGKRALHDQGVEYDSDHQTLGFSGIGAIHRTMVTMRFSGEEIEFSLRSEISPGKWTQDDWKKAHRCPPAPPK